jgi:alpha-galactosidase
MCRLAITLFRSALFAFTLVCVVSADAKQTPTKPPPLAAKPYMGWSSWSLIREYPTEAKILAQADALKANHLDAAGYRYINVDDGWFDGWGPDGLPHANATAFPNGIGGLARAIHDRGLLLGLYINPGIREELYKANPLIPGTKIRIQDITDPTRAGSTRNPRHANDPKTRAFRIDFTKPGAAAYIEAEVAQLATWGVDYLKLDFIGPGGGDVTSDNREEMRQWHRAIVRSKHPLWLEISNFMSIDQATLWRETANGWRIENDIECYGCTDDPNPAKHGNLTQWSTVAERFTDVRPWIQFAGPGGWNDLDTLELGNGDRDGITPAERQSMFTLWAISCAPLYLGSDLTKMDTADLALISNRSIIAIDQAGVPAHPVDLPSLRPSKSQQLWATRYPDGSVVLAIFNLGEVSATVTVRLDELDAVIDAHLNGNKAVDVVTSELLPILNDTIALQLESHASRLLRFNPK